LGNQRLLIIYVANLIKSAVACNLLQSTADFAILPKLEFSYSMVKDMQVIEHKIEIDEMLLAEIEEAAEFEHKTSSDYVNEILLGALKKFRKDKEIAHRYKEAYTKFPQELDDSDEEFAKWQEVYDRSGK
jgi:uncharacterized protein (DUF1778 family)